MKHIKISIIGCSVGIRVRPPMQKPFNKNYGQYLIEKLSEKYSNICFSVNNHAFTRATLKDIIPRIDELISDYPDYIILNIGIPDASNRDIPKWISDYMTFKSHKKISAFFSFFINKIVKPRRSFFVKLRGKKPWVNSSNFDKLYRNVLEYITKETNANIILIPINTPSDRIEKQLPGTKNNVEKYNKIISKLLDDYQANILDIKDIDGGKFYPDGIHYSTEGHKIISEKIANLIVE